MNPWCFTVSSFQLNLLMEFKRKKKNIRKEFWNGLLSWRYSYSTTTAEINADENPFHFDGLPFARYLRSNSNAMNGSSETGSWSYALRKEKHKKKQATAVCINPPPGWNYQIYLFVHNTSTYYAHQQYYRRNILMRNTWHFVQKRNSFGTRLCENDVKVKSFSTLFVPNPFIKPLFSSRLLFFFSLSKHIIFYNIYMHYVRYIAVEFHEPVRLLGVSCSLTTLFYLYYIIFM